jgi:hypothetical protein
MCVGTSSSGTGCQLTVIATLAMTSLLPTKDLHMVGWLAQIGWHWRLVIHANSRQW